MKILSIVLNLLGILSFFLNRFEKRTDKVKEPSLAYWWKDNWAQLMNILIWDVALMLLVMFGGLHVDFTKLAPTIPSWITVVGDGALSFGIGLFGAYAGYMLIKKKAEDYKPG
jgi:hypothetical protein